MAPCQMEGKGQQVFKRRIWEGKVAVASFQENAVSDGFF